MLIGELQKNSTEKIRISLSEYKGYQYIDVRIFFEADDGSWKPTKKGITISRDNIEPLINLLHEGQKKLN